MREILFSKDQAEDKEAVMEVKDYPPYLSYPKPRRPQTNGDRIRAMTDEELARYLTAVEYRRAIDGGGALWLGVENTLDWLQQPVEGGDG